MKKKTIKRKLFFYVKFVRGIMPVVSCTYIYNDHTYYVLISVYDIHLL